MVLEHLDIHMQKKKNLGIDHTFFRKISKLDHRPKSKMKTVKLLEDTIAKIEDLGLMVTF
jgi:hypothetical protein